MLNLNLIIRFYLCLLLPLNLYGYPDHLEIWFVSKKIKTTALKKEYKSALYAQNSFQCIRVGENCFDPQIGLYDPKKLKESGEIEIPDVTYKDEWDELEKENLKERDLSSLDLLKKQSLKCDGTSYFDVFCGQDKTKKIEKKNLEIYIDTTKSMGKKDSKDLKGECYRSSFVRRVAQSCNGVKVFSFNDGRKQILQPEKVCQSRSIADDNRLIHWIKGSAAKKLIVITDKTEVGKKFLDFAFKQQAQFIGEKPGEELLVENLPSKVTRLKKICSN